MLLNFCLRALVAHFCVSGQRRRAPSFEFQLEGAGRPILCFRTRSRGAIFWVLLQRAWVTQFLISGRERGAPAFVFPRRCGCPESCVLKLVLEFVPFHDLGCTTTSNHDTVKTTSSCRFRWWICYQICFWVVCCLQAKFVMHFDCIDILTHFMSHIRCTAVCYLLVAR